MYRWSCSAEKSASNACRRPKRSQSKHTHEETNQQTNTRTNKQTNKQTHARTNKPTGAGGRDSADLLAVLVHADDVPSDVEVRVLVAPARDTGAAVQRCDKHRVRQAGAAADDRQRAVST
jgi:hypothetical protein